MRPATVNMRSKRLIHDPATRPVWASGRAPSRRRCDGTERWRKPIHGMPDDADARRKYPCQHQVQHMDLYAEYLPSKRYGHHKKNIVGMRNLVCGVFHKHWWWKDHDLTKFVATLCLYNSRRLVPGSMGASQAATQNSTERGGGITRCARASFVPPSMPLQHQVALPGVQIQSRRERHAEKRMKKETRHIFRCQ